MAASARWTPSLMPDHHHDHPGHDHDGDGHHHHDDEFPEAEEDSPLWDTERVALTSVGIDIGSATTNVMFSAIELRRQGAELSSRYVPVSREVLYASPPALTPYAGGLEIDEAALGEIIDAAYAAADLKSSDVDTGAVLLTGEATRRRNAAAIGAMFAARGGSFVCAMAGHELEAELAAYGSGAVAASAESGSRLLSMDIGGGTTKLTVIEAGQLASTAAVHVGGRLVAYAGERIVRVEPVAQRAAARLGFDWQVGGPVTGDQLASVAAYLVEALVRVAGGAAPADPELLLAGRPVSLAVDKVVVSGGVAEYLTGGSTGDDLGPYLAAELRRRAGELPGALEPAARRISATVIGASQYTIQVSGNTIFLSDKELLPLANVRAVRLPDLPDGEIDPGAVALAIAAGLGRLQVPESDDVAVAVKWAGPPSHRRMAAFLAGVQAGLADRAADGRPTCLVVDGDVGRSLGWLLATELGHRAPVVSIDGVSLSDFDFVDIGSLQPKSGTVPVSIKTMLYHL
jgi:ethanolamine utilization protein EutA